MNTAGLGVDVKKEVNNLEKKANKISEDEDIKNYVVVCTGLSIGNSNYIIDSYEDKDEAKERAKSLRKYLTPGERKYYGAIYTFVDRDQPGRYVGLLKNIVNEAIYAPLDYCSYGILR